MNELNNKYYIYFSELFNSRAVLPAKQYQEMAKVLEDAYRREVTFLIQDKLLENARRVYEQKLRLKRYIPRKLFPNKISRLIRKQVEREFQAFVAHFNDPPANESPEGQTAQQEGLLPLGTDC